MRPKCTILISFSLVCFVYFVFFMLQGQNRSMTTTVNLRFCKERVNTLKQLRVMYWPKCLDFCSQKDEVFKHLNISEICFQRAHTLGVAVTNRIQLRTGSSWLCPSTSFQDKFLPRETNKDTLNLPSCLAISLSIACFHMPWKQWCHTHVSGGHRGLRQQRCWGTPSCWNQQIDTRWSNMIQYC